MAIRKGKVNRLWKKLFGYGPGTKVRMKRWLWADNPNVYIWLHHPPPGYFGELAKIPIQKFIGEIVGRSSWNRDNYLVKWIADRRDLNQQPQCYVWHREAFDVIEDDED